MKKFITLCIAVLFINSGFALDPEGAESKLKTSISTVLDTLRDSSLNKDSRRKKLESVFDTMFDFKRMAMLSLGRRYWTEAAPEKQQLFTEYFITGLKSSYMDKLDLYSDEKVIFESLIKKDRKLVVPTYLISAGEKISMSYKMYNSNGSWLIYDIEIQGVSIIQTYRSQYSDALTKGSFDDLLETMKPKDEASDGKGEE